MATWFRVLAAVALVVAALVAIVAGARTLPEPSQAAATTVPSTTTTVATTTTTDRRPSRPLAWGALAGGPPRAVVTPTGVVLAVLRENADGSFVARAPCGGEATVRGTPITGAHVVLDPGHGGEEPGAVGPAGTLEKAVNLAIAQEAKRQLEALGATVVLTRTADYRITLVSRGAIATSLQPLVFVSIHHNADPDEARGTPGAETYFQIASPESKRAAGLVYEELFDAFSAYDIEWVCRPRRRREVPPHRRGHRLLRHPPPVRRCPCGAVGSRVHLEPGRGGAPRRPRVPARRGQGAHRRHRPLRHHGRPRQRLRHALPEDAAGGPGGRPRRLRGPPLG